MKRLVPSALLLGLACAWVSAPAAPSAEKAKAREELKKLQDFVGDWKGSGNPDKPRLTPRDPIWTETIAFGWRFKGDYAWLVLNIKGSKLLKSGEVRWLPAKKAYQLTAKTNDNKELVFEGKLEKAGMVFERTDPASKEVQQIKMNSAADGDRFIYRFARRDGGATIWRKEFVVASTRVGVTFGPKEKKPECVVSGGLGTSTVTHMGETYYVCCSGCADAFRENPKKYIDEYKARKAKK
jgi:hypothetical protein